MFRRLGDEALTIQLTVDGRQVSARDGDSVATALLASGVDVFRHTSATGQGRGPYCGMGACFECLVTIDGQPNQQSCLVPVRAGMEIVTGGRAPDIAAAGRP